MSKYTKIIAAFGVAAGLGVASLPVAGTYATPAYDDGDTDTDGYEVVDNGDGASAYGEVELSVTVADYIKLRIDAMDVAVASLDAGQTDKTMQSRVNVSTNKHAGYTLSIVSSDENFATTGGALKVSGKDDIIPAAQGPITAGLIEDHTSGTPTYGWNYTVLDAAASATPLKSPVDSAVDLDQRAITGSDVAIRKKTARTADTGEDTFVTYNVTAATDQAAGTYVGKVKYTATINN